MTQSTHYLTFQVGRQWYGVPVEAVIEVLQLVALDELPATKSDVLGLLTLRNIVMPVIDLRRRFMLDDAALGLDTPLIAIQNNGQHFAIVVDMVDDVIDASAASWQQQDADPYVSYTVHMQNKLIFILSIGDQGQRQQEDVWQQ